MPPFTYAPYRNPYVGSIGELLMAPAHAQAQAAQASGQAYGQAVNQIGQTIAALPGQLQQQKIQAQETEVRQQQLDQIKRENRSRNIFEAELKNPTNYKPDGTVDDAKLTARLKQQDVGAWEHWTAISAANQKNSLDLTAKALEIQNSALTQAEKQRAAKQLQADYLGKLAYHALDVLGQKPGDPLHARDTTLAAVGRAAADGAISEPDAKQFVLRSAQASPDQLAEIFGSFITPDLKGKLDKEKADTAKTQAEAAKATAEAANIAKYGSATPPVSQTHNMRLKGVGDVPVDYVPDKSGIGGKWMYQGKDVSAQVSVIPPASITIHNEKEATGKANRGELVDSLVKGNIAPSQLSRRADDYNATLADASKRYRELTGKDLSIAKLELDYQAARRFVSSQNSTQMNRYRGLADSVVNTIDEVQRLGDLLAQGGVQKWNSVTRNTIRQVYGNTEYSELANQYVGAVNTLKEEFANLANGGYAPTDAAWKLANDQINADFGFKDLRASLTEVQRLINYRTQAFNELKPVTIGGTDATPPAPTPNRVYYDSNGNPIQK